MLVVTRRLNQTLNLFTEGGERIAVTVMPDRSGDQVRLGVECPPSVTIERAEVTRDMEAEARAAGADPAEYCAQRRRDLAARRQATTETP